MQQINKLEMVYSGLGDGSSSSSGDGDEAGVPELDVEEEAADVSNEYADLNEKDEKARLKSQNSKLTAEIRLLSEKLEQVTQDKEKACQAGLELFEENQTLQALVYELESSVEVVKAELDSANMALTKMRENKRLEEARDLSLEQNLHEASVETGICHK